MTTDELPIEYVARIQKIMAKIAAAYAGAVPMAVPMTVEEGIAAWRCLECDAEYRDAGQGASARADAAYARHMADHGA